MPAKTDKINLSIKPTVSSTAHRSLENRSLNAFLTEEVFQKSIENMSNPILGYQEKTVQILDENGTPTGETETIYIPIHAKSSETSSSENNNNNKLTAELSDEIAIGALDNLGNLKPDLSTTTLPLPNPSDPSEDDPPSILADQTRVIELNSKLAERGLTRHRPEIILTVDYLPVLKTEKDVIRLESDSVDMTPVGKFIELNRSIDVAVKYAASNVIKQIVFPEIGSIISTIKNLDSDLRNKIIQSYKDMFDVSEQNQTTDETIIEIVNVIKPEDLQALIESIFSIQGINHGVYFSNILNDFRNTQEHTYDNLIKVARQSLIDSILTYSNIFIEQGFDLNFIQSTDQFKGIILRIVIGQSLEFQDSDIITSCVEVVMLKYLLNKYSEYITVIGSLDENTKV